MKTRIIYDPAWELYYPQTKKWLTWMYVLNERDQVYKFSTEAAARRVLDKLPDWRIRVVWEGHL